MNDKLDYLAKCTDKVRVSATLCVLFMFKLVRMQHKNGIMQQLLLMNVLCACNKRKKNVVIRNRWSDVSSNGEKVTHCST